MKTIIIFFLLAIVLVLPAVAAMSVAGWFGLGLYVWCVAVLALIPALEA